MKLKKDGTPDLRSGYHPEIGVRMKAMKKNTQSPLGFFKTDAKGKSYCDYEAIARHTLADVDKLLKGNFFPKDIMGTVMMMRGSIFYLLEMLDKERANKKEGIAP